MTPEKLQEIQDRDQNMLNRNNMITELLEHTQSLERENADLRSQLERGVKLRGELAEALRVFAMNYQWRHRPDQMLPYEISCRSLYHKYVAIQEFESAQHNAAKERLEPKPNHFGYGIVNQHGRMALRSDIYAMCEGYTIEREISEIENMSPGEAPCRVVELQWVEVQP